jgi:hypothetical protein
MYNDEFKVRTYGFGELAQLYMPHITPKGASSQLRAWIDRNEKLKTQLEESGFRKGLRTLTPVQVQLVVHFIGVP